MSAIKLGSAKDLEKFLKILAEESVSLAKGEKDRQQNVVKAIKRDLKSLTEEDPEQGQGDQPAEKPAPAPEPAPPENQAAPEKPQPAKTPAQTDSAELNPTLSSLIDAIKDLRGGRGASDSAVEAELTAYFDRLDEAERVALIVMMRSIGGIMRQQLVGADAPEPEQYDILMSRKPAESGAVAVTKEKPSAPAAQPARSVSSSGEDTSPPIKIGEPVSEAYRSRIRDLLRRAQ